MKLLHPRRPAPARRGAALLLSILVLFVLIAIVAQISITTMTDARVGRNDVGQTLINQSIRSAQHDVLELLRTDAEAGEEGGGADPMAEATSAMSGEGGEESSPCDSRKDEWAVRQRTEINGIQILIQVEAENSKYNVLNMLNADEDEAEEAFQRVVRIIDLYREGTDVDVPRREAEQMATAMRTYMQDRHGSGLPEPTLLTFDEERDTVFLPQSLRDFLAVEPFQEHHFRSFRDQNDRRVHSLDQFLTVWSSPATLEDLQGGGSTGTGSTGGPSGSGATGDGTSGTGNGAGTGAPTSTLDSEGNVVTTTTGYDSSGQLPGDGSGETSAAASGSGTGSGASGSGAAAGSTSGPNGYGVNLNLAPVAVLKGLFDDRDVRGRFWEDVVEYRNLEEETEPGAEEPEPLYDEFGDEIVDRRAFESVTELSEVRSWEDLQPDVQAKVTQMLETESNVFTLYITGRRNTSVEDEYGAALTAEERARAEEEPGGALVRTVRVVVWRRTTDDGVEIVPLVPWEELDYTPFEIEDYPED